MKLILKFFLAFLFAGVVALVGCGGSDNDDKRVVTPAPTPTPTPTPAVQNLAEFQAANQKVEAKTFDADTSATITLDNGIEISIPASAFTKDGAPVTGNVTVTVRQFTSLSDILFAGLNTHRRDASGLLKSFGFFKISATQDGTALDLATNITARLPSSSDGQLIGVWVGGEDEEGEFAWEAGSNSEVTVNCGEGNNTSPSTAAVEGCKSAEEDGKWWIYMQISKLGWYNFDIYWSDTPRGDIAVTLKDVTAQPENVLVYFVSSEVTATANLSRNEDGVYEALNYIPEGVKGKAIAFAVEEGKFYYAEEEIASFKDDNDLTLTLAEVTQADLEAKIKALNN